MIKLLDRLAMRWCERRDLPRKDFKIEVSLLNAPNSIGKMLDMPVEELWHLQQVSGSNTYLRAPGDRTYSIRVRKFGVDA